MNYSVIRYILGWIMIVEAALMLMPAMVGLIYKESQGWSFIWVLAGSAALGGLLVIKKPQNMNFYVKEGFITVALSWIIMSVVGCLPFVFNGDIPKFTDALFETISGFTTTGATILTDVEGLAKCSLFWRSFTHWIGGMGVLVFLLAIVPMTGGTNMNLMKAESPGPSVDKIVPKVRYNALILYGIYIVLTVLEIVFLVIGDMSVFEAFTTAFSTAGTGGFGIRNDSIASLSPYIQWVVTIFMILFGINFGVYFLLLTRKFKQAVKHEEARTYLIIIIVSALIIFKNIYDIMPSGKDAIRHAFFQVASIMTTTGFMSADFDLWPVLSQTILVVIMFIGACAGSTGGGIKVSRIMILIKTMFKEITSFLHPRSVKKVTVEGKVVEHDTVRATNVFIVSYILIFVTSLFLITIDNNDLVTNFTSVAATINNVGPGLSMVGPTQNFSHFSGLSKYVFMFDMLAGRLEIFPLLLLFSPSVWKGKKKKKI